MITFANGDMYLYVSIIDNLVDSILKYFKIVLLQWFYSTV